MPDNERDLERELRDLGSRLEYPPTPDLARAARQRIEEQDEERAARRGRFWLPALSPRWAVAAMFVVVLAVPALSPTARDTLLGTLAPSGGASSGVGQSAGDDGGAEADKVMSGQAESHAAPSAAGEAMPESAGGEQAGALAASASATAEDMPESGGGGQPEPAGQCSSGPPLMVLSDGAERITLREARTRVAEANCPLLLPEEPAGVRLDAVYETWIPVGKGFSLVYQTRPGLPAARDTEIGMVLTQFPGDVDSTFRRTIPKKQIIKEVTVDNKRGYWVTDTHLDPVTSGRIASGEIASGQRRRPLINVLMWNQEGLSLRLESKLSKEEAIKVAESVR